MANIIHSNFSAPHSAAGRAGSPTRVAGSMRGGFDSAKGLSAMLLAAMVSSLVVVADPLIDAWSEGHLLVAWVALWLVGFVALGVFAGAARKLAGLAVIYLDAWSVNIAKSRANKRMWLIAKSDPRLMSELTAAMDRPQVNS